MKKKYVIVGANYNRFGNYKAIPGAQKSGLDWKSFLDENGFQSKEIITGENATRENILPALTNLFANLEKDDFAVFIYVGHGNQTKIKGKNYQFSREETDGYDEVLICDGTPITDDEIRTLLNLNKNKAPVFILIDACYNGVIEKSTPVLTDFSENNEIAISSATQLGTAYMEDYSHTKQAVYSTFLLKVLRENMTKNYNTVFDLTRDKLKENKYRQNPQLAFTNYSILNSIFFTAPINKSSLTLTSFEYQTIQKDPFKGQTGLTKENEKMFTYLKDLTLKTINYVKFRLSPQH
ncbi:caspase family protein [Chryseobacterium sp. SIMBA_038]|uniref:caspase family protein n=1 Tax=Chryseobacterium sp. SIMBA_038 TaxID=3085780 RepID=UPI00397C6D43